MNKLAHQQPGFTPLELRRRARQLREQSRRDFALAQEHLNKARQAGMLAEQLELLVWVAERSGVAL